ncbi:MAG: hypothetical protein DRP01_03685 [Archaeoglobales archaeon]|nr:MAG: hypothetical protein DRP01_03685 [Archaeoglobales archaeon]
MNYETTQVSAQLVNSSFLRKVENGQEKEAAAEGSAFIRSKLREASFARQVLTPVVLSDDELDRDEYTDLPKKIVEKEPDSYATFVPFKGTGDRTWFSGPRYAIYFGKVESQRFNKSKFELMSYQNDIRKILSDNSVKDMANEEDTRFLQTCIAIATGAQHLTPGTGGVDATNFTSLFQAHVARQVPIGKLVMTKELYYEALKLPATSVGDPVASRHYDDGIETEEKLWGIPVITTIKNDIISNKDVWLFSPENYLGNFFLLQDATLFIKQEADMIEFWSYSAPGIGVGNTKGVTRMTLP